MSENVLTVDLGGTNVRVAIVSRDGSVIVQTRGQTNIDSPSAVVESIIAVALECLEKAPALAAGVAVPAVIDFEKQRISNSPNIPSLNGQKLGDSLRAELGMPIVLDNDATAAMIGEYERGAAGGAKTAVCVTLGTGVGGGLVIDERVFRGADGTAGEVGHINVEPNGHPCGCGSRGCLEQYASATAIVRMTKELLRSDPETPLANRDELTAKAVYQIALQGDSRARTVFSVAGYYLGIALADLVNVLNPDVIVIAGGAANAWELFETDMRGEMKKRAFQQPLERVKIVRGTLGDDAGLIGAASLAFAFLDKGSLGSRS